MTTRFCLTNKALRFMALGLSLAITASCAESEEANDYETTHALDFGVSLSEEQHTSIKTRSADEAPACCATQIEGSELRLTVTTEPIGDTTLFHSPKTRAGSVTDDNFHDSFAVYGYAYKGADWDNKSDVATWFAGDKVSNHNGIWTTDQMRYWPGESYRMHFFAYAPHPDDVADPSPAKPEDAGKLTVSLAADNYTPAILHYTAPVKATAQKDLVVAKPVDLAGDHNQSVDLQFQHILTAVRVTAAKGMSGTITKVAFTKTQDTGSYNLDKGEWSIDGSSAKIFVLEREVRLDPYAENDTPIADGAYTFMMVPQEIYTSARMEVTIVDDNGTTVLEGDPSGVGTWVKGTRVTYRISKK